MKVKIRLNSMPTFLDLMIEGSSYMGIILHFPFTTQIHLTTHILLAHTLSLYLHLSLNISPKSYYTLRSTTYFSPINISSISTHPHQHLIMNNICLLPSFHINPIIHNNNSSQNVAQYISYLLTNSLSILAYKHIFSNPMLGQ